MPDNEIQQVRPKADFASFTPYTKEQEAALAYMRGVSDFLVSLSGSFNAKANPFETGAMVFLTGEVGTGKTHLMEAIVNDARARAPDVVSAMYLYRARMASMSFTGFSSTMLQNKPIILIDDMFSEYQSIGQLRTNGEIDSFASLVTHAYESRSLVIATSNFSIRNQVAPRLDEVDSMGRIQGRLKEMLDGYGEELHLIGPNQREIIAVEKKPFFFKPAGP